MHLGPYTRFADIPQFTAYGKYAVTVPWGSVENTLVDFGSLYGIDLDPDFQRGHVWNETQQIRYVEFILRGGRSGRDILFNQSGWSNRGDSRGEPCVLVDGKQRLEAVRRFLRDEIPAFGTLKSGFEDKLTMTGPNFTFVVNDLKTRAEVLQWYVDLNAGGVVHSDEEIAKVRAMLAEENER